MGALDDELEDSVCLCRTANGRGPAEAIASAEILEEERAHGGSQTPRARHNDSDAGYGHAQIVVAPGGHGQNEVTKILELVSLPAGAGAKRCVNRSRDHPASFSFDLPLCHIALLAELWSASCPLRSELCGLLRRARGWNGLSLINK